MSLDLKFKAFVLYTKRIQVCLRSQSFASLINMHLSEKNNFVQTKTLMTKELHNAIMKRSRYRNKFLKAKSPTNWGNYKIQRNFCKKLQRKTKKLYFDSLNTKEFTDSRNFWRTAVPLFTKKASKDGQIILNETEKCISDDKKICKIFNNFFSKLSQT